jgi:DNA-binding MarR family transcriptional regulator
MSRAADPNDGRAQTLRLTPAGAVLVPELAALADANDAAFFAPLGADDRATLRGLLQRLHDHSGAQTPLD